MTAVSTPATPVEGIPTGTPRPPRADGGRVVVAGPAVLYLALSVGLWWGTWSTHPTTTTTCGCGDAARFLWFFRWPAFALDHGHSILYSQWLFHPTGINLLNDTSVLALGVVLTPVTRLFGPVAAMNVALTLAPALSALAMLALLRRWVRWAPAAVFGGLVYGFSPFLVTELAYNQLNIAFLAIPPLVVMALDDLLIRQRRSPWRTGAWLAVLLTVQFFVSTEVLVITVVAGAVAVGLMVAYAGARVPGAIRERRGHAARGALAAVGLGALLLAYPLWFTLRGPAHLTGPIWSNGAIDQYGNTFASFWGGGGSAGQLAGQMLHFGGYQGPVLPALGYLGAGSALLAMAGLVAWHRDRCLLLFGSLGLVAGVLSLGPGHGYWVPWDAVRRIPWVGDIVEVRFTAVLTLSVAVMAAVTVDRLHDRLAVRRPATGRRVAAAVAGGVAALSLVPTVAALWSNLPLTTRPVVLPEWYRTAGAHLPPGRVVLAYPAPFAGIQSAMAWQAVGGMHFAMAGGGGPEGVVGRAGVAAPGFTVLSGASLPLGPPPLPTPANLTAIRGALATWQVTTVVVPDQSGLPAYDRGRTTAYAVGLFTAALGTAPRYAHSAWVWSSVRTAGAPVPVSTPRFTACTAAGPAAPTDPGAVPACILGGGGGAG